ncbi:MAG: hypothetical protein HKN19_19255 [Halioglobus sp.]|nr:hypothetical protein [Halioglobus sp.]
MKRHLFLIPGFFGFANLGDFTYWGPVREKLRALLDSERNATSIHCVKSLPTASLRTRTRVLLDAIVAARPAPGDSIHLIGHSTGGLDARLLLTPAVDLATRRDTERIARRVRSTVSISTPHHGAPIATFFTSILGQKLLRLLSLLTMAALRRGQMPLSVWTRVAGLFALPPTLDKTTGSLIAQIYDQLLVNFDDSRRVEVEELLGEVQRDQSLLTQLTVEASDLFNAAAGNRSSVRYGSVVTKARAPRLDALMEIGLQPTDQAQWALYYSLSRLAAAEEIPTLSRAHRSALKKYYGSVPGPAANDGIVPTLSQPWGECIAAVQADHLDIIGHHAQSPGDPEQHYDWLVTQSGFHEADFDAVWRGVAAFIVEAES